MMRIAKIGVVAAVALVTACPAFPALAGGPLHIRRITPSGANVTPGKEIVIQFDRTMRPLGNMALPADQDFVRVSPDPGCDWRWLDTTELACRLPGKHQFRPATRYRVTVTTALKALDGTHLAKAVTETFTTELPTVEWSSFDQWLAPRRPRLRLRFNFPVTADAVAAHVRIKRNGDVVPVKATPFTQKRRGPLFLPVPGDPGALMEVVRPTPTTPLDVSKAAGSARRVWLVTPVRNLQPDRDYQLVLTAGLKTPFGSLAGAGGSVRGASKLHTYGAFAFRGIACTSADGKHDFTVHPGGKVAARCRPGEVRLAFSAPVPLATLAAVQWSPAPPTNLKQRWENYPRGWLRRNGGAMGGSAGQTYALTFRLDPMRDYTLTLPAGVKDRFGRTLAKATTVHFRTGHFRPQVQLPKLPAVLESGEDTILPLTFTNLDFLQLSYRRLLAPAFAVDTVRAGAAKTEHLAGQPPSGGLMGRIVGDLFNVPARFEFGRLLLDATDAFAAATGAQHFPGPTSKPARKDQTVVKPMGARLLLGGRSGVLWGHLDWAPPARHYPVPALLQVTPFEVLAKFGHYNTLVWVSTFKRGQAVSGARVRLLQGPDDGFAPLVTAAGTTVTTDASGLAVLPGRAALADNGRHHRLYVSVVKGDDVAILPLRYPFQRWVSEASHGSVFADHEPRYGHLRTWLATSQGIYKPGSDIKFALFVRQQDNTTLAAPPALDYTLKVTDPTGSTVLETDHLKLDRFGEATAQLHVGTNAPTGRYEVSLTWPTTADPITRHVGSFTVTDFVPAAFKVEALLKGQRFGPGDALQASASARLHAGGPYTDAKIRFTTKITYEPFAPDTPVASGFTFGRPKNKVPPAVSVNRTDTQLDHAGNAVLKTQLPNDVSFNYGTVRVEAAVQSARGTRVAARATAVYTARDRYVGLRTDNWIQTAGKPFDVEYVVVDGAGKPQAGSKLTLELQRHDITSTRVKNAAGVFENRQSTSWQTEDQCHGVSAEAPKKCALTPPHPGSYRVLATVTDTRGRTQTTVLRTWVTGAGQVLWRENKGVTLVPDKSAYHVGDVAHVLVQNPFPQARALVTVERYGVLWKKTLTLSGGAPVIDIPIDKSMFPGAWLSVILFSPRVSPPADPDLGKPQVAMGYIGLPVQGKGSALAVTVTPDQPVHKPRQTVHAGVDVRTRNGKPSAHTRVVVAVIDQGVVDLLPDGAKTWDPLARFYAPPQHPDIANYSLAEQLVTRLQPRNGKGESPGGGGGASIGPNLRSQFKTAVYWNAALVTDADGKANFTFTLPDNLTRWRIIAVAMTPGDAMGWGTGSVRVNLPIQVQPALPNQVHVGDRFDAGFSVTNRTGGTQRIATRLTVSGPIHGGKAQAQSMLKLDKYAHALSWLPVAATGSGEIRLTGTATAGKLGDAMTTTIPVRRAVANEVAATYGSLTTTAAKVPVDLPKNALPGSAQLEVNLAPTLLGGLDGAFATMRDDPLNTWEIRLSRGVLASDYLRLEPVLGDTFKWPDAQSDIQDMLRQAANYQAPDGGMAFWIPRDKFVSPYLSVYTALAFDWLNAAGHQPPAGVAKKLRGYIKDHILDHAGAKDDSVAAILRAGAMAALAPHGQLPKGAVAGMLPKLADLNLFGRALLLEAALDTQDKHSAQAILTSLLNQAEESGGELSFNEPRRGVYVQLLATPLRANCAVLDAMVRYHTTFGDQGLLGDTPQKLMRWVTGQRRNAGGWPNSQENVFCTTAMVHYADAYEPPVKALGGEVRLGDKTLGSARFDSRKMPAKALVPKLASDVMTKPFKLAVVHAGQGRLYYNVRLSYALPPDAVGATDAGISVARHYAVQRGNNWQPVTADTKLERGDIIRVALDVTVPTERHHVVVTDPLPGAFEAVNRELATAMTATPAKQPNVAVLMFDGGAWPNMAIVTGGFYHKETALDAVRFFADDLPAGHYRLVYSAQVVSPGTFIAPAPEAKEIYQPDVFGRGSAQHVTVRAPSGQ